MDNASKLLLLKAVNVTLSMMWDVENEIEDESSDLDNEIFLYTFCTWGIT